MNIAECTTLHEHLTAKLNLDPKINELREKLKNQEALTVSEAQSVVDFFKEKFTCSISFEAFIDPCRTSNSRHLFEHYLIAKMPNHPFTTERTQNVKRDLFLKTYSDHFFNAFHQTQIPALNILPAIRKPNESSPLLGPFASKMLTPHAAVDISHESKISQPTTEFKNDRAYLLD